MIFSLTIETKVLKNIVKSLGLFIHDLTVSIDTTGLKITQMTDTGNMVVHLSLDAAKCKTFELTPSKIVFGIIAKNLEKVLQQHYALVTLSIDAKDYEDGVVKSLKVSFSDEKGKKTNEIGIIEIVEVMEFPAVVNTVNAVFELPHLKGVVNEFAYFGSELSMMAKDGQLIMFLKGQEHSHKFMLDSDLDTGVAFAKYDLKKLKKIMRISQICKKVKMSFSDNKPIIFTFEFDQGVFIIALTIFLEKR